ncbi:LytTR family DNA-binding domain-containing protein [Saxibacter everestensis]|uniref:LytTR family DNA-binding domain-containing protein n=1 Tax=Saxibacter everestensis TaxID=2909229 RepID=A0ABY8QRM4_9MICO|nr:LytTR family DNA-binding domain-containing protein [Brevibacteriaceae bacterium ZFBP1038]
MTTPSQPPAPIQRTAELSVLAVDDEPPALAELSFLLGEDPRIGKVSRAGSAASALKILETESRIDAVFTDIRMPGLDGVDLASLLGRFSVRPQVVFVTAHVEHAALAYDLDVTDYVVKPVREERLAEAIRRVVSNTQAARPGSREPDDETLPIDLGGVTRFIQRSDVTHVEASGDYARLHTASGSHLLRTPLSTLEERWAEAGFVRIHRSTLVSLSHVDEIRSVGGRTVVRLGDQELTVARRNTPGFRDLVAKNRRR